MCKKSSLDSILQSLSKHGTDQDQTIIVPLVLKRPSKIVCELLVEQNQYNIFKRRIETCHIHIHVIYAGVLTRLGWKLIHSLLNYKREICYNWLDPPSSTSNLYINYTSLFCIFIVYNQPTLAQPRARTNSILEAAKQNTQLVNARATNPRSVFYFPGTAVLNCTPCQPSLSIFSFST